MKQAQGFTLPELLAVLAIFSITTTMAVPAYSEWTQQLQSRAAINTLAKAINHARNGAITHNSYAIVCATINGNDCTSDWSNPVMVFIDENRNGSLESDEHQLAYYNTALPNKASLTWRGFGSNRYIRYRPSGLTDGSNGSMTYCAQNKQPKFARQLIISSGGRLRFARDDNNDGIREDRGGNNLSCS